MYDINKLFDAFKDAVARFHVSAGNSKLGKIPSFNILPIVTCNSDCMKACGCGVTGCYAVKNALCHGYDMAKNNCLRAWAENTKLVTYELDSFYAHMDVWLTKYARQDGRFFRIHSSGDFTSVRYALVWKRLILSHPSIKFLAFTKQWNIVRQADFKECENLSLVPSGWTGMGIPEDIQKDYFCSYCVEKGQEPPENAKECPGSCETCNACWMLKDLGMNVWFAKH